MDVPVCGCRPAGTPVRDSWMCASGLRSRSECGPRVSTRFAWAVLSGGSPVGRHPRSLGSLRFSSRVEFLGLFGRCLAPVGCVALRSAPAGCSPWNPWVSGVGALPFVDLVFPPCGCLRRGSSGRLTARGTLVGRICMVGGAHARFGGVVFGPLDRERHPGWESLPGSARPARASAALFC